LEKTLVVKNSTLNAMQKISSKNSLPLPRNRNKTKKIGRLLIGRNSMTSETMFTQSPSILVLNGKLDVRFLKIAIKAMSDPKKYLH